LTNCVEKNIVLLPLTNIFQQFHKNYFVRGVGRFIKFCLSSFQKNSNLVAGLAIRNVNHMCSILILLDKKQSFMIIIKWAGLHLDQTLATNFEILHSCFYCTQSNPEFQIVMCYEYSIYSRFKHWILPVCWTYNNQWIQLIVHHTVLPH